MFLTASFVTCNSFYCLWHYFLPPPSALRSGCESQFPTSEVLHPLQTTLAQPGIVSVRVGLSYDPLRFSLRCPMCSFPLSARLLAGRKRVFVGGCLCVCRDVCKGWGIIGIDKPTHLLLPHKQHTQMARMPFSIFFGVACWDGQTLLACVGRNLAVLPVLDVIAFWVGTGHT